MTYTREEWEPASQIAAKVPEEKLRVRLIEALCHLHEHQVLLEKTRLLALKCSIGEIAANKEIAELREKLAEAKRHEYLITAQATRIGHQRDAAEQERDRLRAALEEIQDLDRCVSTFQCRKVAFKALAPPEEKP